MPPKKRGSKTKRGKAQKPVDWAADANFDKNRSIVYIEHSTECPIFQMKADEFLVYLQQTVPERLFALIRNQYGKEVPREGAFEINFAQTAKTSAHNLWSGLEKGPPRRDKFPSNFDSLMPEVRRVLKKFYPDPSQRIEDELDDEDDY